MAAIEQALETERRAMRGVPVDDQKGPILAWRGIAIWVDWDCRNVLHAQVNDIEEFLEEHGEPCTHARALELARRANNEDELCELFCDSYDDWAAEAAAEAKLERQLENEAY